MSGAVSSNSNYHFKINFYWSATCTWKSVHILSVELTEFYKVTPIWTHSGWRNRTSPVPWKTHLCCFPGTASFPSLSCLLTRSDFVWLRPLRKWKCGLLYLVSLSQYHTGVAARCSSSCLFIVVLYSLVWISALPSFYCWWIFSLFLIWVIIDAIAVNILDHVFCCVYIYISVVCASWS